MSDHCSSDAYCVDTVGSYVCQCKPGFKDELQYPLNGRICSDIDECSFSQVDCAAEGDWCTPNNCDRRARCENTWGSFKCTCTEGYAGNGTHCADIDECDTFLHQCDVQASCANTEGAHKCTCLPGFSGTGDFCSDINECDGNIHDCGYDADCENTEGSYECQCKAGFSAIDGLGRDTDGRACFDIDECQIGATDSAGRSLNRCDKWATCSNNHGGYECHCISGYYWDGTNCRDYDECYGFNLGFGLVFKHETTTVEVVFAVPLISDADVEITLEATLYEPMDKLNPFGNNGETHISVAVDLSRRRRRNSGFVADVVVEYTTTSPTNVDDDDLYYLSENVTVVVKSTLSSSAFYHLIDQPSLDGISVSTEMYVSEITDEIDTDDPADQTDIDYGEDYGEDTGTDYGEEYGEDYGEDNGTDYGEGYGFRKRRQANTTTSSTSSFSSTSTSTTRSTTTRDSTFAHDDPNSASEEFSFEETMNKERPCDQDGLCLNTLGSYECKCRPGFVGNGFHCDDLDECTYGRHNCSSLAMCENGVGASVAFYTCTCNMGYIGDGHTCEDLDECLLGIDACSDGTVCVNLAGSYRCDCDQGFKHDENATCVDVEECSNNEHTCDITTQECLDVPGSFMCLCKLGFEPKDGLCVDLDECALHGHDCDQNAACSNRLGSYECKCKSGFAGNGTVCDNFDECSEGLHDCGTSAHCVDRFGHYACDCDDGFQLMPETQDCIDIDECSALTRSHDCHIPGGLCNNTIGSFECKCREGWQGDGIDCEDLNECTAGEHTCGVDSTCYNTQGSYYCKSGLGKIYLKRFCLFFDKISLEKFPENEISCRALLQVQTRPHR